MIFIVVLIALLAERFYDWSHLRNFSWYAVYQQKMARLTNGKSPFLALIATILPILIVLKLVDQILGSFFYGFFGFVFELIVLLYCLGPKNFWADFFAKENISSKNAQTSSENLQASSDIPTINASVAALNLTPHSSLRLDALFIAAHARIFAVIFWYVCLGPVGAILYRLINLTSLQVYSAETEAKETVPHPSLSISVTASKIQEILDFIPARIFTFLFALGGNFFKVFRQWTKMVMLGSSFNNVMLTECGMAALDLHAKPSIEAEKEVRENAIQLLNCVFVITLVMIVVIVLL